MGLLSRIVPRRFRRNRPTIPVVRLDGVIGAGGGFRRGLSMAGVAATLEKAFKFKDAPAIALIINSPGGSPVQSRLIFSRIRKLAEKNQIPVLVFVEDVAASGGYMLAIAGDEIFVDPTSIVGSIGVISSGFGFTGLIDKIGVERRVYTAGKNKSTLDPFQPENKADIAHLKSLQTQVHKVFVDMVKQRRGDRLQDNDDLFTGMFWSGESALELGLVDGYGDVYSVIKERFGEKARLTLVTPERNFFGRPKPGVEGGVSEISADIANGVIAALEAKGLWSRYGK